MSAHSSDDDHNYYTRTHRRSQIPDYDVSHQPASLSAAASAAAATSTPASFQTLPAYAYRQSQEYVPKPPKISTTFDQHEPAVSRPARRGRLGDDSPEPDHFYKRLRDSFIRPVGSVYENLDTTEAQNGDGGADGIAGSARDYVMAAASTSQRSTPLTGRSNGFVSPLSARWNPTHLDPSSTPSPLTGRNSPGSAKTGHPATYLPKGRQSSLQALVQKFNQTQDEVMPVPSKGGSRSASESTSPANHTSPNSFRSRASPQPSHTSSTSSAPAQRHRAPPRTRHESQGTSSSWKRNNSTTAQASASATRSPKNSRRVSTIVSNSSATQSMSDLSQNAYEKPTRLLFGEIAEDKQSSLNPGYGIPRPRRRRGSEGSMYQPNAMFLDDPDLATYDVSPSSPTAWYKGVTPSLDGISLDKPIPPKPATLHRRSRSDMSSRALIAPTMSSAMGKPITILSPPQELPSPVTSPAAPRRDSQSRIPLSSRRMSTTSDSSVSGRSTRAPSAAGYQPSSSGGGHGNYRPPNGRRRSSIPTAIHPPAPGQSSPRSSTPRKSPRHSRGAASPGRQPSPRLQAYISEAPPAKSPPLRSSRPRQSISSATASASRARAAAAAVEQQRPEPQQAYGSRTRERAAARRLPDMGTVDFAARRQRIQQAFTKSMIETEQEEERKRLSIMPDPQLMQNLESHKQEVQSPQVDSSTQEPSTLSSPGSSTLRQESRDEAFVTPAEDFSEQQRGLTLDTNDLSPPPKPSLLLSQDDSPTLGNAKFVDPTLEHDDSSDEVDPTSAVTAGTTETFFDHSPQEDDGDEGEAEKLDAPTRSVTVPDPRPERPMTSSSNLSQSTRRALQSYASDRDDVGSIHIMLGDTPVPEQRPRLDSLDEQIGSMADEIDQGWGSPSEQRTLVEPPHERTAGRQPTGDSHASASTDSTYFAAPTWSPPDGPDGAGSISPVSANTLDSESYTTISRVLDSYSDPSLMSPENISEFQARLFSQSPDLARKGGWDTKKVTQLYLQGLRNKVSTSTVPKPLQSKSPTDEQAPSSADTAVPPSVQPEARRVEYEAEDDSEQSRDAPVSKSLAVPAPARHGVNRASLSNPEDWASTSPSMLDWFHRQAGEPDADEPSSATPTDEHAAPGQTSHDGRPLLPDIPRGGLGIDLPVDGPTERRGSPLRRAQQRDAPPSPSRKPMPAVPGPTVVRSQSPMKPAIQVQVRAQPVDGAPSVHMARPVTPNAGRPRLEPSGTAQPDAQSIDKTTEAASDSTSKASAMSTEAQKKLTRRRHIIRELVDTESSFGQDMTVVVDIYKGTSNVILNSPEDVKTLFGNAHDIVAFSTKFLDALKNAAKAVYVLPRSKRWKSKRDSTATTESRDTDDQASIGGGVDLTDEDKDRLTSIGAAFQDHIAEMEKVYTEYLKNHDAANQKLQQLQKTQKVQIWLKECQTYANDLTTAWDLDSLLVKPVQRILKYSLFLNDLLDVTAENHPDFLKIQMAHMEVVGASKRINEAKKRADLMEQVTQPGRGSKDKRKDNESSRLAITKRFNLRPDKFKQPLGIADVYTDRDYNIVSDKFGSHFFQLQVVMRDVEMYVEEVQASVARFCEVISAIVAYADVAQSTYLEIESKWRRFWQSMRELQMTALTDHVADVRRLVIDPMAACLKLHDGPQKLMEKRKKRVADFARYRAMKDRGDKPDKKLTEQGEQFLALNDTLKDELPRLFTLTGNLVAGCLNNHVLLQLRWQSVWKRKLSQALDHRDVPLSFNVIHDDFAVDFRYPEAQVLSLGICNGAMLADAANLVMLLTPAASLNDEDPMRRTSGPSVEARTGTYGEEFRPRAQSYEQQTQLQQPSQLRTRGASSAASHSPMLPAPDLGRPTESLGLGPHFGPPAPPTSVPGYTPGRTRVRAGSNTSSKSPSTPDMPGAWRTSGGNPNGYMARPSTATGGQQRPSHEGPPSNQSSRYRTDASGYMAPPPPQPQFAATVPGAPAAHALASHQAQLRQLPPSDAPTRFSGIFSSAMPMSDSPPGDDGPPPASRHQARTSADSASHVHGSSPPQPPPEFNVLFLAASVYEFNIDRSRREAGYPYLTYVAGEIFDVIGEKGELWLAKNQDDSTNQIGWIWNKHFAKLAS